MKYELILLTEFLPSNQDVCQDLASMSKGKLYLVKTRLILIDPKEGKGAAFGRNLGASLANSSILLFADDDSRILDDIASLVALLQTGNCQGIQPLLIRQDLATVDSAGESIKKVDRNRYTPYCRMQGGSCEYSD